MVALVTNNGLANVIAAWAAYASRPQYIQVGAGSSQGAGSNDVASPVGTRSAAATSQQTTNVAGDTFRISGTYTAAAAETISEVGVFDASSGGNMGVYGDFTAIDLAAGDAIVFSISVVAS